MKDPISEDRMMLLEKEINKHIKRINCGNNIELLEIYHLFYDFR